MNKKIRYVYVDLDGTLLKSDKSIPSETLEYFNSLRKQGIKIGIITGRSNCFVKYEADTIKPDLPLVTVNGGIIYKDYNDLSTPMFEDRIESDFCEKFIKFINKNNIPALAYTQDGILVHNPTKTSEYISWLMKRVESFDKKYSIKFTDINTWNESIGIYKFLLMAKETTDDQKKLLQEFLKDFKGRVGDLTSETTLMDIMALNTSKGNALHYLESEGYITKDETIVFGDENNDLSMFEVVDQSVAMINGTKEARITANFVTKKTNDEQGVMEFLKEYLK